MEARTWQLGREGSSTWDGEGGGAVVADRWHQAGGGWSTCRGPDDWWVVVGSTGHGQLKSRAQSCELSL